MKYFSLNQFPKYVDDFFFRFFDDVHKRDAIVIWHPADAMIVTPVLPRSRKSLEEHIEYIQKNTVKKAIIAAEEIGFLDQCPSLEYLQIYPSITAENFDYSPVYTLPNLKYLSCETMYGLRAMYDVPEKVKVANLDYSRVQGVRHLVVSGAEGNQNVNMAESVRTLYIGAGFPKADTLSGFLPGKNLQSLAIAESPIRNLDGIEVAGKLRRLELAHNRRLTDISALASVRDSLVYLRIEACGKINDFSVLSELQNLEFLVLKGVNRLPNLSFLGDLPNLKYLHLTMNVEDGDLSICEKLPYVRIQNRRHYSHKNEDLPKKFTNPDEICPFELI